jgi:acetyl esterase/lipase
MRLFALLALLFALALPAAAQVERPRPPAGTVEIAYGGDPLQRLDFTPAARGAAPLVLFIHGGGWRRGDKRMAARMAAHFHGRGYAFASINYRLAPDATVDQQGADTAAALARLLDDAPRLGIDRRKVMLIGHSAGAHLAALVGTDPAYLAAHHIPVASISGVVLLDGAGYDVPRQVAQAGPLLRRLYTNAFGTDEAFQRRVSPIAHVAAPNAARFLILHIASRPDDSGAQSRALAAALRDAGTPAEVASVDNSHAEIFRDFGTPGHRATQLTDAFADRIFGSIGR